MEEKLICAVCDRPELYDTTCLLYRDRNKKEQAWVKVAKKTGFDVEFCRKRWKSLRDTYLKEKRKEKEKRSGAAAEPGKRWKFSAVLSFLDPFILPRETSGNMGLGVEDDAAGNSQAGPVEVDYLGEAAGPSGIESRDHLPQDSPDSSDSEAAPAASPTADPGPPGSSSGPAVAPAPARGRVTNVTKRKRVVSSSDTPRQQHIEELLIQVLQRQAQAPPAPPAPPRPPPSEDEMFLLSLLPSLQRLSPQQKDLVKFQIHKLIFEAGTVVLNLEQVDHNIAY